MFYSSNGSFIIKSNQIIESMVSETYTKTADGKLCSDVGKVPIATEGECIEAATSLGLTWNNSFKGKNDHPHCLFSNDGRKKVHFNTNTANVGPAKPSYQSICKTKTER